MAWRSPPAYWMLTTASAVGLRTRLHGSTTARQAPANSSCSVAVSAIRIASCHSRYVTVSACCEPSVPPTCRRSHPIPRRRFPSGRHRISGGEHPLLVRFLRCRHRRRRRATVPRLTVPTKTALSAVLLRMISAARCASVLIRARSVLLFWTSSSDTISRRKILVVILHHYALNRCAVRVVEYRSIKIVYIFHTLLIENCKTCKIETIILWSCGASVIRCATCTDSTGRGYVEKGIDGKQTQKTVDK